MDRKIYARESELVDLMLKDPQLLSDEYHRVCGLAPEIDVPALTDSDRIREILVKEFGLGYWPMLAQFGRLRPPPVRL